ncbi:MAG: hydrogenase expression/formation protein HypE [Chlorobium phaeobacteroides]|uniref:Hydrogenase expression/formation protein HypE n=1 Tax=Chlorobium phaeobacteroides (strain BS1) TaxID=331678 RepID=B3EL91_CHLPB|nr:hydrogenase expression/formation protein HypE [Chlorobium phaeobacteroides]MBL6956841.1 hydrogenase expression/formation protein HypE [Chlorobium phaeobacteroides]
MQLSCPSPILQHETVQMAHGAGGRLSQELTARVFMPHLNNPVLDQLDDQARFDAEPGRIAFTTDTYVVTPVFFPGGNIGDLAVNGTVNDLAVGGAMPRYLSAGFVLEEGLPLVDLERIVRSMAEAARKSGVVIACGDTKVVQKGQCDRIFINTSGVGFIPPGRDVSCRNLLSGDAVLLSGTIGDHGMAILTTREGLSFQSRIQSDSAALNGMIADVLQAAPNLHAMRDPTRGGVAATLNELAASSSVGIELDEGALPVREEVRGAAELLGIDPLTVANEGKVLLVVPAAEADAALVVLRAHEHGSEAAIIGEVVDEHPGMVVIRTSLGSRRILDMPLGEQLPRIC